MPRTAARAALTAFVGSTLRETGDRLRSMATDFALRWSWPVL